MEYIYDEEAENIIFSRDKEGNMPVLSSGKNMNMTADDMAILHCIGITICNENYPSP